MADRKSGYERAAEIEAQTQIGKGPMPDPKANGDAKPPAPAKPKKSPRKVDDDLRATSQIMDILRKFSATVARRILRNCGEKIDEQDGPSTKNLITSVIDPRRQPGGDLYTAPLPGLEDRDHG